MNNEELKQKLKKLVKEHLLRHKDYKIEFREIKVYNKNMMASVRFFGGLLFRDDMETIRVQYAKARSYYVFDLEIVFNLKDLEEA